MKELSKFEFAGSSRDPGGVWSSGRGGSKPQMHWAGLELAMYVAKDEPELLPPSAKCWNYTHAAPWQVYAVLGIKP